MKNPLKKQKKVIGVSPDALVFRGVQRRETVDIQLIDFDSDKLEEVSIVDIKKFKDLINTDTVSWINVNGLHDDTIISEIGETFGIESYVLSDIMNTNLRPKVQEHDNYLFVSLKMLMHDEDLNEIDVENISLIIMDHVLISFQEKEGDVFDPVRQRIRDQRKRIRTFGTDYLAFALLDIVIDNYIYSTSALGEKIDELEVDLLEDPDEKLLGRINLYKKEINYLRRYIKPGQEMILLLSKMETPLLKKRTAPFYKELVDNVQQASELTDSYREILSDQLNVYHTTMSTKLNDVMKFLTIFSVIFIPLTFIAGIYGTNFEYVPELDYRYSYFIMWGIMVVISIFMIFYFKKKKWL
ncbi:magnesium/cobalt transporter CorA [bacterium]|nr:magnesium/cobalt transporter CorA [bacterium]